MRKIYLLHFPFELMSAAFYSCWAAVLLTEGKSLSETASALALFYFAMSILQIPSGLFADKFGRRLCAGIGALIFAFGAMFAALLPLKLAVYIAFGAMGTGITFIDGAKNAWLRNYAQLTEPEVFQSQRSSDHFYLNLDFIGRLATITGAFGGVGLLNLSPFVFWISLSVLGAGLFFATLTQNKAATEPFKPQSHSLEFFRFDGALKLVLIAGMLFGIEQGIRNLIGQPYTLLVAKGNIYFLAYFQSILAVSRMAGNIFYRTVIRPRVRGHSSLILPLPFIVFGCAELWAARTQSFWIFLPPYALGVMCLGWYFPLRESFINSLLSERYRATLLSLDSMLINISSAATLCFLASGSILEVPRLWTPAGAALILSATVLSIAIIPNATRKFP